MIAARRNALLLSLALVATAVGLVDAVIGGQADFVVVFVLAGLLQAAVLVGLRSGPRPVLLRADLAAWVYEHTAATGEPADRLVDRCVAAYRAGLTAERRDQP
jgi:hypothetical protein